MVLRFGQKVYYNYFDFAVSAKRWTKGRELEIHSRESYFSGRELCVYCREFYFHSPEFCIYSREFYIYSREYLYVCSREYYFDSREYCMSLIGNFISLLGNYVDSYGEGILLFSKGGWFQRTTICELLSRSREVVLFSISPPVTVTSVLHESTENLL